MKPSDIKALLSVENLDLGMSLWGATEEQHRQHRAKRAIFLAMTALNDTIIQAHNLKLDTVVTVTEYHGRPSVVCNVFRRIEP